MAGLLCYLIWYKPFAHQSTNPLGIKPPDRWSTTRKTQTASDVAYLCKYTSWVRVCVCVFEFECVGMRACECLCVGDSPWPQEGAEQSDWEAPREQGDCKSEQKINEEHLPADKLYGIIHFEPQFAYVSAPSGFPYMPSGYRDPKSQSRFLSGCHEFSKRKWGKWSRPCTYCLQTIKSWIGRFDDYILKAFNIV